MEFFVTSISVQQAIEGFKPKMFQVSVGSQNTVNESSVDFKVTAEIPFNDALKFSDIESLALAQVNLVLGK